MSISGWFARGAAVALALGAAGAHAQIGLNEQECSSRWGKVLSAHEGAAGMRTVAFSNEEYRIEAGFVDGVASRMLYRKAPIRDADIEDLLRANSEGHTWAASEGPPQAGDTKKRVSWLRSDDMVQANLDGDTFTVTSAGWNQRQREVADRAGAENVRPVETNAPPPSPDTRLARGCWVAAAEGMTVALQFRPPAGLSWITMTGDERREIEMEYRLVRPASDQPAFDLTEGPQRTNVAGTVRLTDDDGLQFTPRALSAGFAQAGLVFHRAAQLPEWKPRHPASLPADGDSKQKALGILGPAAGIMRQGHREILVYPWGEVFLVDGRVISVQ